MVLSRENLFLRWNLIEKANNYTVMNEKKIPTNIQFVVLFFYDNLKK